MNTCLIGYNFIPIPDSAILNSGNYSPGLVSTHLGTIYNSQHIESNDM